MANYAINYESDFSIVVSYVLLSCFQIEGEDRRNTNKEYDAQFLPQIFLDNASPNPKNACSFPFVRPRRLILRLNDNLSFIMPVPYRGNSPNFNLFINQVIEKNPNIPVIELDGERQSRFQVKNSSIT